jgi:hypothetical protein
MSNNGSVDIAHRPAAVGLAFPGTLSGSFSAFSIAGTSGIHAGSAVTTMLAGVGTALGLPGGGPLPLNMLPRRTYVCTPEYGLPGGSEYACIPLQEVWEDLVPQLHVRVSGR